MKSTSHFAMAHLVYASLKKRGVLLDRAAFVYGNIAPDYLPSVFFAPHFAGACARGIRSVSGKLSAVPISSEGKIDADYCRLLGIMCHYICDYFCFPHNREFSGTLKEHSAFEAELDSFLRKNCLSLLDVEAGEPVRVPPSLQGLRENIESMKREYNETGYTFENDLCFSFNACVASILALVAISRRLSIRDRGEEISDARFPIRSSYVFRMFFYKNRGCNIFFLPELMLSTDLLH